MAKLKNLKILNASHPAFGDSALTHFAALSVEEIHLTAPPGWAKKAPKYRISFDGFRRLLANNKSLVNLKKLILKRVRHSSAQKTTLKALRQGLQVVH